MLKCLIKCQFYLFKWLWNKFEWKLNVKSIWILHFKIITQLKLWNLRLEGAFKNKIWSQEASNLYKRCYVLFFVTAFVTKWTCNTINQFVLFASVFWTKKHRKLSNSIRIQVIFSLFNRGLVLIFIFRFLLYFLRLLKENTFLSSRNLSLFQIYF